MTQSREAPSGQPVGNAISRQTSVGVILWRPPSPAGCQELDDFPHRQHRPSVIVHVGLALPVICSTSKKRGTLVVLNQLSTELGSRDIL